MIRFSPVAALVTPSLLEAIREVLSPHRCPPVPNAPERPQATARPRYPKSLGPPSRQHWQQAGRTATLGIAEITRPRRALIQIVGDCSWQGLLHFGNSRYIKLGQVLNDFGEYKCSRTKLRGASSRVTPSLIRIWPPFPRTTCNGGIPSSEIPNFAICRASFSASAPCGRLGGKCNSPGLTAISSDMWQHA